jgi:hypothetical protein
MNERYKILPILRQHGYHHGKSQCIRGRSAPADAYKIICTRPGAAANHIPILSPRRKMHALTRMSPRNMQHNHSRVRHFGVQSPDDLVRS